MKRLFMLALLVSAFNVSNAQDKQFVSLLLYYPKQLEKAKTEIDKIMLDPKAQAKPEGWLWQTRIYAEFSYDSALNSKYPGSGAIALEAFKKYESMEPSFKSMSDATVNWRPLNLIYLTGFNNGRKYFETKQWDSSFAYFSTAAYMGEIIAKHDLKQNGAKIDTLTVVYAGYAAQNAKKEEEAVKYYRKLADLKVGGEDYKDLYSYILVHYANTKDATNFNKYLALAKEVYPAGAWEDYEVDFLNKAYTLAEKVALYDKEDAAGALTARKYLLFGQMFTDIRDEKSSLDSTKQAFYQKKAAEAFMKAYKKDNTLGIAAFNAGVIYYNEYGLYDDRYRGNIRQLQEINTNKTVEKDPKKKAAADAKAKEQVDAIKKANIEIDKQMWDAGDISIEWLEKSYIALKDVQPRDRITKDCLNRAVDFLANIFAYKKEKIKSKDPKAYDAYDTKYKLYDGLHGTFK